MDEKGNIIKYYRKTGESLTNLTGFSFGTRVGATANAFVLLNFSIKEPLQLQLPHEKNKLLFHVNSCDLTQLRKGPPDLFYQNKTAFLAKRCIFWTLVLAQPPTLSSY